MQPHNEGRKEARFSRVSLLTLMLAHTLVLLQFFTDSTWTLLCPRSRVSALYLFCLPCLPSLPCLIHPSSRCWCCCCCWCPVGRARGWGGFMKRGSKVAHVVSPSNGQFTCAPRRGSIGCTTSYNFDTAAAPSSRRKRWLQCARVRPGQLCWPSPARAAEAHARSAVTATGLSGQFGKTSRSRLRSRFRSQVWCCLW